MPIARSTEVTSSFAQDNPRVEWINYLHRKLNKVEKILWYLQGHYYRCIYNTFYSRYIAKASSERALPIHSNTTYRKDELETKD